MVEDLLRRAPGARTARDAPRLRRPWRSRLSRAHVVALAAALVAGTLNVAALRQGSARTPVLVAAADLQAGDVLDAAVVGSVPVAAEGEVMDALIPADRMGQRAGWLLARPLRVGEPLRWSDLRDPTRRDGLRAMSLPVEPSHAVGGGLRAGDRVDVIAVREGQALWVLSDVEVLGVADQADRGALAAAQPYALTLALTEVQALRLAWAMHDGAVEVVRATGAPALRDGQAVLSALVPPAGAASEVAP